MNKYEYAKHFIVNRKISIKKVTTLFKSYFQYKMLNYKFNSMPSFVSIEPTNICNLKCDSCPSGSRSMKAPLGFLSLDTCEKIIDELSETTLIMSVWGHGEPFLNKNLFSFLEYANKKKIFTRLSTNAHFLNNEENNISLLKSGVDNIIIAIDGATQSTYEKYRKGGNLNLVLENIKNLMKLKNKMKIENVFIEIQFIVMNHNISEIDEMKKLAKEIGVDKLQLIKYVSHPNRIPKEKDYKNIIKHYVPKSSKFSQYTDSNISSSQKCWRPWLSTVINWDGTISICTFDSDRVFEIGNITNDKFTKIWSNPEYIKYRQMSVSKELDICQSCVVNNKIKTIK
jgi:radical SAM protein with 4Fe4S-binding SPASM domain